MNVNTRVRSECGRGAQAGKIGHLLGVPHRQRPLKRPLARRPDASPARVHDDLGTKAPEGRKGELRLRAHSRHGGDARPVSPAGRERSSSQRRPRRQPPGKPRAVDTPTADRHTNSSPHTAMEVTHRGRCSKPPKSSPTTLRLPTERSWRRRVSNPGPSGSF